MTWRERLLPARFRGIPFLVQAHEVSGGRIVSVHQVPSLRDGGFVQDIGRQLDTFQFDAFLVGPDYDLQRQRLEKVCKAESPGFPTRPGAVLVHPYFGRKAVVCQNISLSEEYTEQEMCRVSLTFIEAGASSFDASDPHPDPGQIAVERANDTDLAAGNALEASLQVDGVPESVRAATSGVLGAWADAMALVSTAQVARNEVAAFANTVTGIAIGAASLATSPVGLVREVQAALAQVTTAVAGGARGALAAYESLLAEPLPFAPTGSSIEAANANADTTRGFIRQSTIASAVRSAVEVDWISTNEAMEARSRLEAAIETQILIVSSDSVYHSLVQLRAAMADSLPLPSSDLATVENSTQSTSRPSLVLAYDLGALEEDLIQRNSVSHPGFVPAGQIQFLGA